MSRFSIIVPIFQGGSYINGLIKQAERCAECMPEDEIELILSNDDPLHPIDEKPGVRQFSNRKMIVQVLNTEDHRGIHAARVRGLSVSTGDFILFLDQDDCVVPNYFLCQRQALHTHGGVVCNVRQQGQVLYQKEMSVKINRERMLTEGCGIVSPGQVLLRQDSIPGVWKRRIIKKNGADDWFLWICMLSEGVSFALNPQVLFERGIQYGNASFDGVQMADSIQEVLRAVEEEHILSSDELCKFRQTVHKSCEMLYQNIEKQRKWYLILDDWMYLRDRHISIATFLQSQDINRVAVYGLGVLGKHLLSELQESKVEVAYIIDQKAKELKGDMSIYTLDEDLPAVDAVVATMFQRDGQDLGERAAEKTGGKLLWLEEIIYLCKMRN